MIFKASANKQISKYSKLLVNGEGQNIWGVTKSTWAFEVEGDSADEGEVGGGRGDGGAEPL